MMFLKQKIQHIKSKVNSLEKTISDRITLVYINQYNTYKQNLEKKMEMLIKNTR